MAKQKTETQAALAITEPVAGASAIVPESEEAGGMALLPLDAAGSFDFDFESDGLDEVSEEDLRFAAYVWNMGGIKPGGGDEVFRKDEFFNTLTEKSTRKLRAVLIYLHKTNDYSYFDNASDETKRVCSSYDRVTGRLRVAHPTLGLPEGTERKCDTCPDGKWVRDPKTGKNTKNCGPVYGVFGVELDDRGIPSAPFIIRFKRTSLEAIKNHMQKHHIGRLVDEKGRAVIDRATGKPANVHFFTYAVEIALKLQEGGKYALPEITRIGRVTNEMAQAFAQQAKFFKEMATDVVKAAEKKEQQIGAIDTEGSSVSGGGGGGQLDQNDFQA